MTSNNTKKAEENTFQEIQAFSVGQLQELYQAIFADFVEVFKEDTHEISNQDEKEKAIDKLVQIRTDVPEIIDAISKEFIAVLSGEVALSKEEPNSLGLALVDDVELEESIFIGNITEKINETSDLSIRAIRRGMVRIGKKCSFEPEPAAFEPKGFSEVLKKVTEPLGLEASQRQSLLNCYQAHLLTWVGDFYAGILAFMQESGVITEKENPVSPDFEVVYQFRKQHGDAPNKQSPNEQSPNEQSIEQPRVQSTDTAVDDTLNDLFKDSQSAAGLMPKLQSPVAASALTKEAFQDNALMRLLYDYMSKQSGEAQPDDDRPVVESEKLVSLLNQLQSQTSEDSITSLKEEKVAERLQQQLSADATGGDEKIAGTEANVIDLIDNLFIAILEDEDLADPVKVQVGRLQIPYIKVALIDIALLKEEAHPARLLLNELAVLGMGVESDDSPILKKITEVCQNVIANFESDLTVFMHLLKEVREFHQAQTQKAGESEQKTLGQAETQAKVLHLKKNVVQSLRDFLKEKKLPQELYALTLKGFAPLFLKIQNVKGRNSPLWEKATDLFRRVVESTQPSKTAQDLQVILARVPDITAEVVEILKPIDKGQVPALLDDLKSYYQQRNADYQKMVEESGDETIVTVGGDESQVDPFEYRKPGEEENSEIELPELEIHLPETLKIGVWCEVYMGRNRQARRLKLATIMDNTQQLIFVDAAGEEAKVKDMAAFAEELDCEQSKIISENNLFDKALAAVISNMHLARESA